MSRDRHRFGLCMYGIQYLVGGAGRGTPNENPRPLTAVEFLALAVDHGLSSIEVSLQYVSPSLDPGRLREYADEARREDLDIVIAGPNITATPDLAEQIQLTSRMGVRRFRCTGSGVLCGDRSPVGGFPGWQRHVDREIAVLRDIAPVAEDYDVRVGIENHQDHDSADLLRICDSVGSEYVGVTLDTGNPIAVGEDPVAFAERILPFLVDVHLKDYRMINTPHGFRLVHCAIGSGVVEFGSLWPVLDRRPEIPRGIEMAALSERHIRIFDDAFWDGFGPREARSLAPVMKIVRDRGEHVDDPREWQTPLERAEVSSAGVTATDTATDTAAETAAKWESRRLEESIRNLASIASASAKT